MTINDVLYGKDYILGYYREYKTKPIEFVPFGKEISCTINLQNEEYNFDQIKEIRSRLTTFEGSFSGYLINKEEIEYDTRNNLFFALKKIKDGEETEIKIGKGIITNFSIDFSLEETQKITFDFKGYITNQNIINELLSK